MPFTSPISAMPFSSDPSGSLSISLTDAWIIRAEQRQTNTQDSLQFFAQSDGFQGGQLALAFGATLRTERLRSLGEEFAQGDFSGVPAIALLLQPTHQWRTKGRQSGDSYDLSSRYIFENVP